MTELPKRVQDAFTSLLRSSFGNRVPQLGCLPQQAHQPQIWYDDTGPFADLKARLWKVVKPLRPKDDERWVERQHFSWYARNIIDRQRRIDYVRNIDFRPKAQVIPSVDDLKRIMKLLGLGKTLVVKKPTSVHRPSKYCASNGVTYDPYSDMFCKGKKGRVWTGVVSMAHRRQQRIVKDERLVWNISRATINQIIEDYGLWYVPFFRFDNPHWAKPRLLWGSESDDYVSQIALTYGLGEDEKNSPFFSTTLPKVARQLAINRLADNRWFLNLDIVRYDLHQDARLLWNLRRAHAELYRLDTDATRVAIFNAIANIYAPLVLPNWEKYDPELRKPSIEWVFQEREGIASSGAGDFARFNSILALIIAVITLRSLDTRYKGYEWEDFDQCDLGMGLGDNVYVPTPVGVKVWDKFQSGFGMALKPQETLKSDTTVVMLKNLFDLEYGGWEPVVCSLAHKALTSADLDLRFGQFDITRNDGNVKVSFRDEVLELKTAIRGRARRAILVQAQLDARNSSQEQYWRDLIHFWDTHVFPNKLLMRNVRFHELSNRLRQFMDVETFLGDVGYIIHKYKLDGDTI